MRKGFGFHDRHSPFRFNPATLFRGGANQGVFYDPSNIATLFQDDAGTAPVTAVEQTVGRMLDLSGNGNHATQSASASRPTLSARVNLLTKTEQFDDAAWTKINATISPNATTAPDGLSTADKFVEDTSNSTHTITVAPGGLSGTNIMSLYAKAAERSWIILRLEGRNAWFDLANGVVGTVDGGITASISNAGGGWWRCFVTRPGISAGAGCTFRLSTGNNIDTYLGDGTSGAFIWGGDLRRSIDTVNVPSYQRVNTATDYDTVGFPLYLAFDGSNDSLLTGNINFSGTDKVALFAGLTKLSDAARGIVLELTDGLGSGLFNVSAPLAASPSYSFRSIGGGTGQADINSGYPAPITNVLTGIGDISGDIARLRLNGVQVASSTADQGVGNYSNAPLYIGRRNNASNPFNGRLYGLIVLGAAASDWQVQVTEQWMAGKTGLQF